MRRHRPGYTFEPYERVPDGQVVHQPTTVAPLSWRLAYLGFGLLIVALIVIGSIT